MRINLVIPAMFLLFLAVPTAQALQPFALVDDFSGDRIDVSIWNGSSRPQSNVLDFAREVKNGELRLMNRTYSDPSATPGTIGDVGRVRLHFNNSGPVTQILALVRVNAMELNDCTSPATVSEIRARLDGFFFTTGGAPAAGDATRNIFAEFRLRRRTNSIASPGVMQVVAEVGECSNAGCNNNTTHFFDTNTLGTIIPGQPTLLALVWDPDNDRFIFVRDSLANFTVYSYNGVLTDVDPPSTDVDFVRKPRFEVRAGIETCTSGPAAMGFMDFSVDKVWVNQSVVVLP